LYDEFHASHFGGMRIISPGVLPLVWGRSWHAGPWHGDENGLAGLALAWPRGA
jgi:hypothetical protein